MEDKIKLVIADLGEERIKKNELLKYHLFSQLGGPAQYFYVATSQKELIHILDLVHDLRIPFTIIGSGTKMLISDKGIKGLVIKNRTSAIKIGGIKGKVGREGLGIEEAMVEVDSGVTLSKINEYLKAQHLKQIEGISSQNSTIGGSIFLDPVLIDLAQKINVWEEGDILGIDSMSLNRLNHVVVSVVLKVKAK